MTSGAKKQYTAEFKREAVALVTEQGYTLAGAARNLGINRDMLWRWKHQLEKQGEGAFPGKGHQTAEQAEPHRLRAENRRLRYRKLNEFDQKLGNSRIHNPLIVQHSGSWPLVEIQLNLT